MEPKDFVVELADAASYLRDMPEIEGALDAAETVEAVIAIIEREDREEKG